MDIFKHKTYKEYFKSYLNEYHHKGIVSSVAKACGCDRTYLSQVLTGKSELTADHVINFSQNMNLNEIESEFLLTLLLHDRSASSSVRKSLKAKIDRLRDDSEQLSKKIKKNFKIKSLDDEIRNVYYSNWLYPAVHILTSIPEFQTIDKIANKLQCSPSIIQGILVYLVDTNLIKKEKENYIHSDEDIYLSIDSPQNFPHHLNWRVKAVERTMAREDIHYTCLYSVSKNEVESLRDQIVQLIETQRKQARSSGTEEICVFCCDFFKL